MIPSLYSAILLFALLAAPDLPGLFPPFPCQASSELCKYHQKAQECYLSSWIVIISKVTAG